jgi:arylsulfatase A-like enzyme
VPLARTSEFAGRSAGGMYGDVIEEIDWSTGRILDALAAAGLDRQTLVLFTSDNGPWLPFGAHGGSAGPLANGKGTTWEGGVRTPAIFWWPGTIRPDVVTEMASSMDVFVTAARLAGAEPPADRPIDGYDLTPRLKGSGSTPRRVQFYYWDNELRAIRPRKVQEPPLLFDLAEDPGEQRNVAAAHQDVVADLVREAEAHRTSMTMGKPLFDELLPPPGAPAAK